MKRLATPADFLAYRKHQAPLARLFVVTGAEVSFFKANPGRAWLGEGRVFHGEVVGEWVKRLPSEGGGYCAANAVREVV